MKNDITRDTFEPRKHYRSVRQQQGRVQLDADWNEQMDIQTELDETTNRDVIGPSGAPIEGGGFKAGLTPANDDLTLTPGRMYVDGILCELEADPAVTYLHQPYLPNPPALNLAGGGTQLAYLDVWRRHITAIEDPQLREVALGGPDTATRLQTIWQVKLQPQEAADVTCKEAALPAASDARLTNELQPAAPATDPCELSPAGGYHGLENHLYRVEVHTGGPVGTATFKWSRENGSVALAIEAFEKEPDPSAEVFKVRVKTLGRDDNLGLHVGDWVEVLGDETELNDDGVGTLAKILAPIDPHADGGYSLVLSVDVAKHSLEHHPKLRRWDQVKDVNADGTLDTAPDFVQLEHGVRVKFAGADLHPGDYWMFAARTGTLVDPLQLLADAPPHGVRHHYAPLALITFPGGAPTVHDCRPEFPALTALTSLFYLSGDGQEAMPDLTQPNQTAALPQPLRVGVANGKWPVAGARVRFKIDAAAGNGKLVAPAGAILDPTNPQTDAERTFLTGADGTVACQWELDGHVAQASQAVAAELLDEKGARLQLPIRFTANLSVAARVAYDPKGCPDLAAANVRNVQDAIDELCKREGGGGGCDIAVGKGGQFERLDEAIKKLLGQDRQQICICLLPGDHELDTLAFETKPDRFLTISGCGHGTRLIIKNRVRFSGFGAVRLKDFAIRMNVRGIIFERCLEVEVSGCYATGTFAREPLIHVASADRITIAHNRLESHQRSDPLVAQRIFASRAVLAELFKPIDRQQFVLDSSGQAEEIAQLALATRKGFASKSRTAARELESEMAIEEVAAYDRFLTEVFPTDSPSVAKLSDLLRLIRDLSVKGAAGVALLVTDDDAATTIEDNDVAGAVSFYGMPGKSSQPAVDQRKNIADALRAGALRLVESGGILQMHHNRISHVTAGAEILRGLVTNQPPQVPVYQAFVLTDNVIEAADNLFLARHLALTGTRFRNDRVDPGTAVAETATYIGNSAYNDVLSLFSVVARPAQLAANLNLNIVAV